MLYSVYQQLKPDETYTYKLLQLPGEILDIIKANKEQLILKSSVSVSENNHLVVCSDSKTWKLRQMNHSNSITMLDNFNINHYNKKIANCSNETLDERNNLIGFANTTYEYELAPFTGVIDKVGLPVYNGKFPESEYRSISIEQLLDTSAISHQEFLTYWYEMGGCEVDNLAVILSDDLITEILTTIITILIAQDFDYAQSSAQLDATCKLVSSENSDYSDSMVTTVVHKFAEVSDAGFKLNNIAIAQWFGIQTLAQSHLKLWKKKEFLMAWKSALPEFYSVSLDLKNLQGYFCRPMEDRIRYVDQAQLSTQVSLRFTQLFQLAPQWDYNEFIPLIDRFVAPGKKVDSLIMKYAKKKKVAKDRFIVVSR